MRQRRIWKRGVSAIILALLPVILIAKVPTFDQSVICEEIALPLPKGVMKEAPKVVETFTYSYVRGRKSGTEERYDARQLWEDEQRLGRWVDKAGNVYELVALTSIVEDFGKGIPAGSVGRQQGEMGTTYHLTKEMYKENRKAVGKLNRKELGQWLIDWTGEAFKAPQNLKVMGNVSRAMYVESSRSVALIFFLKVKATRPYGLLIYPAKDPPSAWKSALTRVVSGVKVNRFKQDNTPTNQGGWQEIEGEYYRVYSNLPLQQSRFLEKLIANMTQMRKVYTTYLPEPKGIKVPQSVIRVFASPEAYRAYVGAEMAWSSGFFSSTHRELVVMGNAESGSSRQMKDDIRSITFHEGFHQYLFLITPPTIRVPIWFNEGHATFFETFQMKGGTLAPTLSQRLQEVANNPRFCSPEGLAQLLSFDHDTFYLEQNRMAAYATSWLLVHWLYTEAPKALRETLRVYYAQICKEKTVAQAQAKAYPPEVLKQISQGLLKFLEKNTDYRPQKGW